MKRAETYDEIKPLAVLCKAGRLFEVQQWIAAGKPVNPPRSSDSRHRRKSPLEVSMDCGFHSLVQVLLESGAAIEEPGYRPLEHALLKRRLDLVAILVDHGADIHSVSMESVFDTWLPEIMEYFIERGADVETGHPMAGALCSRIRTALGIFKRFKDRFPSFKEQANVALRFHAREGNLKWVSLMLWAGADPHARGSEYYCEEDDPECAVSALELAALHGHFDIFKLKSIRLDPSHAFAHELLRNACFADKADFLNELLKKRFNPNDQENGGSSLISSLLGYMTWSFDLDHRNQKRNLDTSRSREKLKMVHLLARHGARWIPANNDEISDARRSLIKMSPDYTVEFIWIMSKYKACARGHIEELIRTPSIRALVSGHLPRIAELLDSF
jgi:hypothetical protein